MESLHIKDETAKAEDEESAQTKLTNFLTDLRNSKEPVENLEEFEQALHKLFAAAEAEVVGEQIARFDIDLPFVTVNGVLHHQVLRCEDTYFTSAGPTRAMRSLYSTRKDGSKTISPMELQAGIIEGRWTPHAARQAAWVVAHLTPGEGEELFEQFGGLTPSKSSLDRLPKKLSRRWEQQREQFEQELRSEESVPDEAVSIAVSLDGVMVPMKKGMRKDKRNQAVEEEKYTRGPAGNKEVGCGTVSFYDEEGERLKTVRMARMPESKKATLKTQLTAEMEHWLIQRPDLVVVKLADGAKDNWTYLSSDKLPEGPEGVDFFHAAEHLGKVTSAAYGDTSKKGKAQFKKLRHILLEEDTGVEKIVRSIVHLRDKHPRIKNIQKELKYFRGNRHRMRYAELKEKGLPIGTGVTEAACKTLATQRLKKSGMRWGDDGGQAILTFRALVQSNRFDRAWNKLAFTYKSDVAIPDNVVPIRNWLR